MDSRDVKRLTWAGLLLAVGALARLVAHRLTAAIWRRAFKEEPPE